MGAVALRCLPQCLQKGSLPLALGLLLGGALAMATRTRYALLIYLSLGVAFLAGTLFAMPLPTDAVEEVRLWAGAPSLFQTYPEIVRTLAFVFAIPYPFARFGYHAPDRAQ